MSTIYLLCALLGGGLLVLQTLLLVMGHGGDSDFHVDEAAFDGDHHGDANLFFKVLSIKTVVAFIAFFGLAGKTAQATGSAPLNTFLLASVAGVGAFVAVFYLGRGLIALQSNVHFDLESAVGTVGEVYLPIPGHDRGRGKVTLHVEGRRIECEATTADADLSTGTPIRVLEVLGSRWVHVERVDEKAAAQGTT